MLLLIVVAAEVSDGIAEVVVVVAASILEPVAIAVVHHIGVDISLVVADVQGSGMPVV